MSGNLLPAVIAGKPFTRRAAAVQSTGNGTPNLASPNLASPNVADGRTQGGAAEPQSAQKPGAAAICKSLSTASNGPVDARLPRLNLRSVSMPENSDSTLSISRYGPKPETDSIGVTHRGPPPKRPYEVPPSVPEAPARTELVIQLVSPAFSLDPAAVASLQAAGTDLSAAALQRASTGLGVDRSALRLFEMREVPPGAPLAEDADHVAVAIIGSSAAAKPCCDALAAFTNPAAHRPVPSQAGTALRSSSCNALHMRRLLTVSSGGDNAGEQAVVQLSSPECEPAA